MHKSQTVSIRRAKIRAFATGFVTGVAAPALLLAGTFEAPIVVKRKTMRDSVAQVGHYFRAGVSARRSA